MGKEKKEIAIRSSAAEYLTYVAAAGDQTVSRCGMRTKTSGLHRR